MSFTPTQDRCQVWFDTKNYYKSQPNVNSKVYNDFKCKLKELKYDTRYVDFVKGDCVDVAVDLVNQGYNPLLLNMSSWVRPGGGVETGAGAQEEDLFRRSNYHKFLHKKYYPMPMFQAILSPKVEFIRKSRTYAYTAMESPVKIDCVASPAIKNPMKSTDGKRFSSDSLAETMLKKIRMLFEIAYENNNDSLVLSAWGCGAFRCPVEHVAELFKEVVKEYDGCFRKVSFAIVDSNYEPFKRAYETK